MAFQHQELAAGGWQKFSLMEQLGNIGSEVSRAARWKEKDSAIFEGAVTRTLELFDLTLDDPRWKWRQREIARARELFCDAALGNNEYRTSLQDLVRYFDQFAYAARLHTQ